MAEKNLLLFLADKKPKIQAMNPSDQDAALSYIFERAIKPQVANAKLTPPELEKMEELFKARYLGYDTKGLEEGFGFRETEREKFKESPESKPRGTFRTPVPTVQERDPRAQFARTMGQGFTKAASNLTSLGGLVPNPVSETLAEESANLSDPGYDAANPIKSGAMKLVGEAPLYAGIGGGAKALARGAVSTQAIGIRGVTRLTELLKKAVPALSGLTVDSLIMSDKPKEIPGNLAFGAAVSEGPGLIAKGLSRLKGGAPASISAPVASSAASAAPPLVRSFEPHAAPANPISPVEKTTDLISLVKSGASPDEILAATRKLTDIAESEAKASLAKTEEVITKKVAEVVPKRMDMAKERAKFKGVKSLEESKIPGLSKPKTGSIEEMAMRLGEADRASGLVIPKAELKKQRVVSLPSELRGSKPRYGYRDKSFELEFVSDVDKAAYIVASRKTLSKADQRFLEYAMKASGLPPEAIIKHGQVIKGYIKNIASTSEDEVIKIKKHKLL